jgi:hypothetical protein
MICCDCPTISPPLDSSRHERTSPEGAPLSHATSCTSSLSRHQGLVKRSIELRDLKPVNVLFERFTAWKAIVRQPTAWFEVRLFYHLYYSIHHPRHDIFYTVRDQSRIVADHHANLGRTWGRSVKSPRSSLVNSCLTHRYNLKPSSTPSPHTWPP